MIHRFETLISLFLSQIKANVSDCLPCSLKCLFRVVVLRSDPDISRPSHVFLLIVFIYSSVRASESSPVSGRGDEVYAAVNSGVWDPFLPVDVDLLLQVRLILVVNELHDGLPAGTWREK